MRKHKRKLMTGVVVSRKMEKTAIVNIQTLVRHSLYEKVIRRFKHIKAHDEENSTQPGDRVLMMETRPISKEKRWKIIEVYKNDTNA